MYYYIPYQYCGYSPLYMMAKQDDADYEYMRRMCPESYHTIHRHVVEECDRREKMGQLPYEAYPPKSLIEDMTDEVYKKCKDYFQEDHCNRQVGGYYGGRRLLRDLVAVILIGELFRRRRLYRRRYYLGY